jgi:biotin transport system substrate-specific component
MSEMTKEMSIEAGKEVRESKWKTLDLAYIGMFVALIAVCSWINIPTTVPFTLQTFAVFATVAILGMRRGTIAVAVYIILGAVGVPVFSGFKGGLGTLFGTTGGYIVGFLFTALITGGIIKAFGKKIWVMAVAMVLGLVACYAFGTVWFICVYTSTKSAIDIMTALTWCVIPFIIPDLCKIALAILLEKRVGRFIS